MADETVASGELRLSDRGFREDIELAMGNDVRRALIELVTNADDSYVRLGQPGEIVIEVEHRRSRPKVIRVSDEAEGMSRADIDSRLAVMGDETSGFDDGTSVRGFFGRGGRDVVHFGPVSWTTWKDGEHHEFSIEHRHTATREYRVRRLPSKSRDRRGTDVRLEVQDRFRVPRHSTLLEDLSRHYALRPIITGRSRSRIFLRESGKIRSVELAYPDPKGNLLEEGELAIQGYPDAAASYVLHESPTSLIDGKERTYWKHSLTITSRGAAYDVFSGGRFSREPEATHLGRLYGSVDIPGLAILIQDLDLRESKGLRPEERNPTRLVRRDREGLVREHPFVKALQAAL